VKTILAVDDSATVRQMTGLVLRGTGFEVLEAVDGVDALAKLTGQERNLILTDLNMPNMDGLELTRRVRLLANYKFVPAVLLTTESQPEKKLEGKAAGATAWLVKPFSPDQLLAVVKKVIT
jgi:two-component system, chemotaxis family, chemotaxis protein CheY